MTYLRVDLLVDLLGLVVRAKQPEAVRDVEPVPDQIHARAARLELLGRGVPALEQLDVVLGADEVEVPVPEQHPAPDSRVQQPLELLEVAASQRREECLAYRSRLVLALRGHLGLLTRPLRA